MFGAKWAAGAAAGVVLALGAVTADANTIDFTSSSTGTTGSLFGGSVTWTMTSSGVLNNSQLFDGATTPVTSSGLSFQTDGYGVGAYDDEITTLPSGQQESITVTFSSAVLVNALYFLDLFISPDQSSQEVAVASINGGFPIVNVYATDVFNKKNSGFASATFAPIWVTEIYFTVLSTNDSVGFADGALAGIGLAPVPVPAAGLLLLGGLGGLAAFSRRRKAA